MSCKGYLLCLFNFFLLALSSTVPAQLRAGSTAQGSAVMAYVHPSDTTTARKLIDKAYDYFKSEQYQYSIQCLHQAEALTKPLHVTPMCITICRRMFAAYQELGKLDSALIYANMLLKDAQKIRDLEAEMDAWNYKAILYNTNLELDSALNAYKNAYERAVELKNKKAQAVYSSNMGIIFGQQRQYSKAYEYFRKAYWIGREIQDTKLITLGAMNLGRGFTEEEKFDSAAYYLDQAQKTALSIYDSEPGLYHGVINFQALLNFYRGNFEKAEIQYKDLLAIYSENQQNIYLAEVYSRLAEISLARKNYEQAVKFGLLNLDLLYGQPAQEIREQALLVLTQAYGHLHDYEKAFDYGEKYRQLRDSSYGEKVTRMVAEVESKYQLEKKNAENMDLSLEARQQKSLARRHINLALITSLITVIILGILFFFYLEYRHKKQLNRQLEATVKDRTAELEASNQQLKKTVEELRTFGHITSHDLKEPLRNISGFSSLLERKLGDQLDTEGREFLAYIKQNTHQMRDLIQDILIYSTIEEQPFEKEPVELSEVIQKVKDNLNTLIEKKNGLIHFENLPTITSNDIQLFTTFKNLIENGLKYNRAERPEVHIKYEKENDQHYIFVRDNGIGIPHQYQEQIFQLFKRLHSRSEYMGTGMGLAISRKIITRLGGELRLESREGQGSLFTIVLPAEG